MKDILECYKALELNPGATPDRVRQAYIELAAVWNPDKHMDNPPLRAKMEKRRMEIDEAYVTFKQFMPELRHDYVPPKEEKLAPRDYNEMSQHASSDIPRTVNAILITGVLFVLFAAAYYLFQTTRTLPTAAVPVSDPEAMTNVALDTSTLPSSASDAP